MTIPPLCIIDSDDHVIGQAPRETVTRDGLLHRWAKIFFITPQQTIIFQRRAMTKDFCPGLLDATAGGGVDRGEDYMAAAIRETAEETGVVIVPDDLHTLGKIFIHYDDPLSGAKIRCFSTYFGYVFRGQLDDLRVEDGSGAGFAAFDLATIFDQPVAPFIPFLLDWDMFGPVYQGLGKLVEAA